MISNRDNSLHSEQTLGLRLIFIIISFKYHLPRILTSSLCPGAHDSSELFGHFANDGTWKDGLIPCLLKRMVNHSSATTTYAKSYDEKRNKSQLPQPKQVQVIYDKGFSFLLGTFSKLERV